MAKNMDAKEVKSTLVEYTSKRIKTALMLLLYNIDDLMDDMTWKKEYELPGEVKKHLDFVLETVRTIDVTLLKDTSLRDSILVEISDSTKALLDISRVLYNYLNDIEIAVDGIEDSHLINEFKEMDESLINKNVFINDCMKFIGEGFDNGNLNIYVSDIMRCFPVKMAREKLYDYIRESLTMFLEDFTEEFFDDYIGYVKDNILPEQSANYGKYFVREAGEIAEIKNAKLDEMSNEDIKILFESTLTLHDEVVEILDYINILFESYNYISIVLTFAEDLDGLFEGNMMFKDIFYTTVDALTNGEYDLYKENLDKMFEDQTVLLIEEADAGAHKVEKALERLDKDNIDEETSGVIAVRTIVDNYFYADMKESCYPFAKRTKLLGEKITKDALERKIEDFVSYFKELLSGLSVKKQKQLKQTLITYIVCPMNEKEFIDYISYAFDATDEFCKKSLILEKVGRVFEKYGFGGFENEHKHHHEHGEDCGCGHEHHEHHHHDHGADCDCGHHH